MANPDDPLDRLLREAARAEIPDAGFASRVMAALPRATAGGSWLKSALILGSAALGSVLAVLLAPAGASVVQGFVDLAQLRAMTPSAVTGLALCAALLVSAIVLAADTD